MATMEGKPIQINPDGKIYEKVSKLSDKLRIHSRGGFCELMLEFVLPKIESGELVLVNGRFIPAIEEAKK